MTLHVSRPLHAGGGDEPVPVRLLWRCDAGVPLHAAEIQRYLGKISGPLLDRIDLHDRGARGAVQGTARERPGVTSAAMRERVQEARALQAGRGFYNAHIPHRDVPQADGARRGGRADARDGRAPHGPLRARARPHPEGGPHDRRSRAFGDGRAPNTSPKQCSTAAWTGTTGRKSPSRGGGPEKALWAADERGWTRIK